LPAAERAAADETQAAPAQDNAAPNAPNASSSPVQAPTAAATTTNANQQPAVEVRPTEQTTAVAKIKFSFSETSWVNVTDHNKKMIFDRIMPAGSEETVQGEPPLQVVVGNAPGSRLVFNDKPVDLAPYTRANVARVTLE